LSISHAIPFLHCTCSYGEFVNCSVWLARIEPRDQQRALPGRRRAFSQIVSSLNGNFCLSSCCAIKNEDTGNTETTRTFRLSRQHGLRAPRPPGGGGCSAALGSFWRESFLVPVAVCSGKGTPSSQGDLATGVAQKGHQHQVPTKTATSRTVARQQALPVATSDDPQFTILKIGAHGERRSTPSPPAATSGLAPCLMFGSFASA
ncbi:unnamed protein product, partial [Pylaiella littoralis]